MQVSITLGCNNPMLMGSLSVLDKANKRLRPSMSQTRKNDLLPDAQRKPSGPVVAPSKPPHELLK